MRLRVFSGALLALCGSASGMRAQKVVAETVKPGVVHGIVYDSIADRPLRGVVVQVVAMPPARDAYNATTDSSGAFRITNMKPGTYAAGFFAPVLDSLGIEAALMPVAVTPGGDARVSLGTPSIIRVIATVCGPPRPGDDGTGLVLGHVRDAESGEPVAGGTVVVIWNEFYIDKTGFHRNRRQQPVKTDERGWYAICRLTADSTYSARAERGHDATGFIEVTVPARGIATLDFAVSADTAPTPASADSTLDPAAAKALHRGVARITGTVTTRDGRPVAGAQVAVEGAAPTATTSETGAFSLAGLPSGTQSLEVRAINFSPKHVRVSLSRNEPKRVAVVMESHIARLDRVTVYGKTTSKSRDIDAFLQRTRSGAGHYLTREQLDSRPSYSMCDLLRTVGGINVQSTGGFGCSVTARGTGFQSCSPATFLDGTRLMEGGGDLDSWIRPQQVAGLEVYSSASSVPAQFTSTSGNCGAIVVWTRR
ncbi:MAG: carboxypeptidase regulatory-like domain-containing protein [Gemmatimonadaceae bacterium]